MLSVIHTAPDLGSVLLILLPVQAQCTVPDQILVLLSLLLI